MKNTQPLSPKWKYSCLIIGIAALFCSIANFYYKHYLIGIAVAIVAAVQFQNYRRWKKNQS